MKSPRIVNIILAISLGLSLFPSAAMSAAEAPNPQIIDQENNIRREAEAKIQNEILDRILGPGLATALVNVEVSLESEKKDSATSQGKVEDNKKLGDQDYILPWVPAPKTVNKSNEVPKDAKIEQASGEVATAAVKQIVSKFDVTIIHDNSVSKEMLKLVDDAIKSAYVRYVKVLKIAYEATKFAKFEVGAKIKQGFWDFFKPLYIIILLIILITMFFLFGILAPFLQQLLKALVARKDSSSETKMSMQGENKNDSENETEGENAAGEGELTAEEVEAMKKAEKFVPLSFIDETNLERLAVLVHHEPPDMIAMIMSYLKPEQVKKVLTSMSPELQAKVAMNMVAVKQMTEAEIRALDADIKAKIDFLVGGLSSLIKVLEEVDYATRDNILEYLKNERPRLYEKVRKRIMVFDDIAGFPDDAVELIVRELKADNLGKALQNASPEVREKIFKNMSKGAAALLKEEMDFGKALPAESVNEERQKILITIKNMENTGKLKIREKASDDFLDWEDLDLMTGTGLARITTTAAQAQVAADPQKAQEYSVAGQQFYNEQKYGEALQYFQYAVQLDPNSAEISQFLGNSYYALGQYNEALAAYERVLVLNPQDDAFRQWVEQLRVSIATPAS